jgi:hypothetical protein
MGDDTKKLETDLRFKVEEFLTGRHHNCSGRGQALLKIVDRIRRQNWNAVLFGGTLRDLMIYGDAEPPRDVDIVFAGVSTDQIAALFADGLVGRTRFGGLHLKYEACLFDMWSLADTWALKKSIKSTFNFEDLPKTTFLNVEAIELGKSYPTAFSRLFLTNFWISITRKIHFPLFVLYGHWKLRRACALESPQDFVRTLFTIVG